LGGIFADTVPRRRTTARLRPGRTSRGIRYGCARQRLWTGDTVPGELGGQRRPSVRGRWHVAEPVGHRSAAHELAGSRKVFGGRRRLLQSVVSARNV